MEERKVSGRREVLRLLRNTAGAALLLELPVLTGCGAPNGPSGALTVPLSELPLGQRVSMRLGEVPLELLRTESGVEVRSLQCTHMGCQVRWVAERSVYQCPCHDGRFDADGRVLGGPPPRPLDRLPARIEGDAVVVDG